METLQFRAPKLQLPRTQFMNSLFSKLRPKISSSSSSSLVISNLKPFCKANSALALKRSVPRVSADAAQLKEDWLDSLTCPFPDATHQRSHSQPDINWVIGIDPDLSGALALLKIDQSGCSAQVFDSPHLAVMVGKRIRKRLDAKSIVQLLCSFNAPIGTTAYIEQSIPYPQDGKQGWWSGGFGYGLWIGILVASGFSVIPVPSVTWKNAFELLGGNCTKDDSRRIASTLFPSLSSSLKRKKDHGRAEALLIAAYGKDLKMRSSASCILEELPCPEV